MSRNKPQRLKPLPQSHSHCVHVSAVTGFNLQPNGQPGWIARQTICCHCAELHVTYIGIDEVHGTHGAHVSFQSMVGELPPGLTRQDEPEPQPAPAAGKPILYLPSNPHPLNPRR